MTDTETPLISMKGITKRFTGVVANQDVDFDVRRGEVHALLGENGAGKSTLMDILYGLYRPDSGAITVGGVGRTFASPRDAIAAGIGMVHQHFMLIQSQKVWENMILGLESLPEILPRRDIIRRIADLSAQYGLEVDPMANVWQLSVGEQQRVAILQMLYRKANVLILDEPTAVLTPQEAERLFETIRQMTSEGHGVVFISHKLDEVMRITNRVTILRRGRVAGSVDTAATSKEQLAEMMMGEKIPFSVSKPPMRPGERILEAEGITVLGDRGFPSLSDVTLEVRANEILGVAGVAGNGQQELCEALAGLRKLESGRILLSGTNISGMSSRTFIDLGIRYIPADRKGTGLVPNMNVEENSILKKYWSRPVARGMMIDWKRVFEFARSLVSRYSVSTPSLATPVRNLSGGNLQKLMLGRELSDSPQVVIAMHPTWGLDVSATRFVREQLLEERKNGAAVLLVSEDLDELQALSDRLAVLCKGELMGIIDNPADVSRESVGLMMAGTPLESVALCTGGA